MEIAKAILAKEIENVIKFIYPRTTADIVEYDNSAYSQTQPVKNVQEKIDELQASVDSIDISAALSEYYKSTDIDDIMYIPVTINSFTSSVSKAEIGTSGVTNLNYSVTRMSKITRFIIAGEDLTDIDGIDRIGSQTYSGSIGATFSSPDNSTISQSFSVLVTDTATSNHAATTVTRSAIINYYYPVFYGMLDSTTITAEQITALNKMVGNNNKGSGSYTFPASSSNGYMWYCCQSNQSVNFSVGGFSGGFEPPITIENVIVNSNITTSYKCYRSTNRQTANLTVAVS